MNTATNSKRNIAGGLLTSFCAAAILSLSQPASAKAWIDTAPAEIGVRAELVKNSKLTLRSDSPFAQIKVADTDVADIVVITDQSFHLVGKERGTTSVMIYDKKNRLVDVIDVVVGFDLPGLKKSLFDAFPNEQIGVRKMAEKLYLSGTVSTANVAAQAEKIAQAYGGAAVSNGLVIRDSHQVSLDVRFVEASRSAIKDLGVGLLLQQAGQFSFQSGVGTLGSAPVGTGVLQGIVGPTAIDVKVDALEEKGIIRTLAEPNLVSMSGETASFLAGGEFPVPVQGTNGDVSITFRQFGVGLSFTPTVLDDGIINLKVAPEVSQLDPTNSVRVGGVEVPSLNIRRANTTVELRNSQSFAIAGLLQNTSTNRAVSVPWLADVPVLGALFRSTRYKKQETELVIIVTPRLVQPVSDISQLKTPLDGLLTPDEMNAFLLGQLEGQTASQAAYLGK